MRRLTFKDEFGRYIYSPDTDLGEVIDRLAWYENLYDRLIDYYKRCPHCGAHMKSAKGIDEKLIDVKSYVYE